MSRNAVRYSIDVPSLGHGTIPIPTASRIGPFIATGGVRGVDQNTGKIPADIEEQIRLMFENLRTIVEAAGTTCEGILKITVWARSGAVREALNRSWIDMFPDPAARPVRHLLIYDLPGGMEVQCEALAFDLASL